MLQIKVPTCILIGWTISGSCNHTCSFHPTPLFQSTISQYKKMMSQFVYTHTTRGQGGLEKSGVLPFQQLGPSCIYSQGNNNCPSRSIHTRAEIGGELPEREILLGEIYGPWANVGEHIMEGSVIIYLIFPSTFMGRTDLSICCLLSSECIRLGSWKKSEHRMGHKYNIWDVRWNTNRHTI